MPHAPCLRIVRAWESSGGPKALRCLPRHTVRNLPDSKSIAGSGSVAIAMTHLEPLLTCPAEQSLTASSLQQLLSTTAVYCSLPHTMVYIDQTQAFQSLIAEGSKAASSSTRHRSPSRSRSRTRRAQDEEEDRFLKEAYQIVCIVPKGSR